MTHDNPKSVIDHEAESTKILADANYANTMEPILGLTYLELEAMRLLSMPDDYKLSQNQAELVSRFLEGAKGNEALNRNLKKLTTFPLEQYGLNKNAVEMLRGFADKTRHSAEFSVAFNKLNQNEPSRLTLKEYAVILDFLKTKKLFDFIQSKIALNADLASLAQKVTKMPAILAAFDEQFKKEQSTRPAALLFGHASKMTFPYNHLFSHLVTKQGVLTPQTGVTEEAKDLNMRDYLYSDNFSIKIESLLSEKNQSLLLAAFGPDWLNEVNKMYENLEREIHDDLFRQVAGISKPTVTQPGDTTLEDGRLICSEFLSLTVEAALNQLDAKLKAELKNKKLPVPEQLIAMPFSKQENLSDMTPLQAINFLTEKGCVEKRQPPRDQFTPSK